MSLCAHSNQCNSLSRLCILQVLQPLEGVGVVVFPEFRLALLPPRGAVAGGLGLHPVARQSGIHVHESKHRRLSVEDRRLCLKR